MVPLAAVFIALLIRCGFSTLVTKRAGGAEASFDSRAAWYVKALQHGDGENVSTDNTGPIVAWLPFSKVGSTTLRDILMERAVSHNWKVPESDTDGFRGSTPATYLCHAKGIKSDGPPKCSQEPTGSVILTDHYGWCEELKGARECQYMTMLRDPVEQTISAYGYFCRDCQEGLFCNVKGSDCPNMTIIEWARRHGNLYTRKFGGELGDLSLFDGYYVNDGWSKKDLDESAVDLALQRLQAENMMLLWTDSLDKADGEKTGLEKLAEAIDEPEIEKHMGMVKNTHSNHYEPTKREMALLKHLLRYDIQLYDKLRENKK
mmetsp:Transcript_59638/g.129140  ORF Transcript_59638/g.129140 Transcript_59638/m.129140 type:complete len:318 (+) Transcript_59638:72-1025(+)